MGWGTEGRAREGYGGRGRREGEWEVGDHRVAYISETEADFQWLLFDSSSRKMDSKTSGKIEALKIQFFEKIQ